MSALHCRSIPMTQRLMKTALIGALALLSQGALA
ncbi:PepSY domain-containing protein, partial [Xanthomonas perforans]|nr:PepSY domain-containing protein [Xanthomonas perforans]